MEFDPGLGKAAVRKGRRAVSRPTFRPRPVSKSFSTFATHTQRCSLVDLLFA